MAMNCLKISFVLCATLTALLPGQADELVMRDASSWKGKVIEVRLDRILFRKDNESFDREVNVAKVFKIKYDNGTEDIMQTDNAMSGTQNRTAGMECIADGRYVHVSTRPDCSSLPPASHSYSVGDWYDENGVRGVVVGVTPDGKHGKIISPVSNRRGPFEISGDDPMFKGPVDLPLGMNDLTNGYANLQKLLKFRSLHPEFDDSMYPALMYVSRLGEGWYVPAIGELEELCRLLDTKTVYNGSLKSYRGKSVKWIKVINRQLKEHDGDKIGGIYFLSSTEDFSQGGEGGLAHKLFGDPEEPQFVVFKYNDEQKLKQHTVRSFPYPTIAFHLF